MHYSHKIIALHYYISHNAQWATQTTALPFMLASYYIFNY